LTQEDSPHCRSMPLATLLAHNTVPVEMGNDFTKRCTARPQITHMRYGSNFMRHRHESGVLTCTLASVSEWGLR
jgi:hypothetical protein